MFDRIFTLFKIPNFLKRSEILFYSVFTTLFIWCISSLVLTKKYFIPFSPDLLGSSVSQVVSLKILLLVFIFIYKNKLSRINAMFLGSVAIVILGKVIGFYDFTYATQSVNIGTISLLFGMSLISIILAHTNIFNNICKNLIESFGKNNYALFVVLCLLTYFLSLFVNNFTAIFLILPITLTLTTTLKLNSIPFIIGEIIASNLGGASTMVGDFPNMFIANRMNIPFHEFIKYLMPLCLINLGIMLYYFNNKCDFKSINHGSTKINIVLPDAKLKNKTTLNAGLLILAVLLILFIFSSLSPGFIALCGSFLLFLISGDLKKEIIKDVKYDDVVFFILLFIFVGGIEASGLLKTVWLAVLYISGNNLFIACILLMWAACFVTLFLNAGPTTALFIPMFLGLDALKPSTLIFWALSLGVCAGSCATLNGATAGPIACTFVERFNKKNGIKDESEFLTFANFSKYGLPLMYLFLVISTIYITIIYLMAN